MEIRGAVAIVTGASSGLGRRVAERLAAEGAHLGLLGRDRARLDAVAATCRGSGARTHAVAGDIADEKHVAAALEAVASALGPVDIVVNNAGVSLTQRRRIGEVPLELWDEMQRTNVRGTFLTCNRILPLMRARGRGVIVNIGSTGAHVALPGVGPYAASKHAVRALTDSAAQEYEGTGVRVCMVSAGPIDTPYWDRRPVPPTAAERAAFLRPDDIADAIIWLITRPAGVRCDEILLRPVRQTPLEV